MKTTLLQSKYEGVWQDNGRIAVPPGYMWTMHDLLPNWWEAPARARGPWLQASPDLSEAGAATAVWAVAYAPFAAGSQLVAITSNNSLWKVDSSVSATDKGNAGIPLQRPVFFKNLLVVPVAGGSTTPFKYDGSAAPAALGGSPPQGQLMDVYKERLLIANSAAEPRRIWFSAPGDPQVWDTTDGWLNASRPVTGLAALNNVVLVWSLGGCERLRGSTPPPSREMELEPKFEQGCIDPRSIVKMGDQVIWANVNGIWMTDGAAIEDLTKSIGLKVRWQELLSTFYSPGNFHLAGGEIHGNYVVTMNVTSGGVGVAGANATLVIDVQKRTVVAMSNTPALMYAEALGAAPELYFGHAGASGAGVVVGAASNWWKRAASPDVDPFGTGPTAIFQTNFYRGEPGSRRIENVWLGLDYQTPDNNSYLKVGVARDEADSDSEYVDVTYDDGSLFKIFGAPGFQRVKIPLKIKGSGFGLQVTQVGPCDELRLYDIEAAIRELESSK